MSDFEVTPAGIYINFGSADNISRQAALDALGEEPLVWHEDDAGEVAERNQWRRDVAAIKALPSAQPGWIPCSERLPEKSDQYYVSGGDKVWICEFLIIPNSTGGWCNDVANPVVQAWMPLPKPWEGDKNE